MEFNGNETEFYGMIWKNDKLKRLSDFIEYDAMLSNQEFAQKSGIDPSGLYKMLKGQQPISMKTYKKIADAWGLSLKWLTDGVGPQYVEQSQKTDGNQSEMPNKAKPFFGDLPVSGGRVIQYPDIFQQLPTGFINLPQVQSVEAFFPVIGMSMRPTIEEGEIVGVCHIDGYETTNADRVYMIITNDDERMIKRILKYDSDRKSLILGSDNPNYPNTELHVDLIVDVYKVVCHMKIETL